MLIGTAACWAKPWFAFACAIPTLLSDADARYNRLRSKPLYLNLPATAGPLRSVTVLVGPVT